MRRRETNRVRCVSDAGYVYCGTCLCSVGSWSYITIIMNEGDCTPCSHFVAIGTDINRAARCARYQTQSGNKEDPARSLSRLDGRPALQHHGERLHTLPDKGKSFFTRSEERRECSREEEARKVCI